jgi:hypothetical protein
MQRQSSGLYRRKLSSNAVKPASFPAKASRLTAVFVHGDARRNRRIQTLASIRARDTSARPVGVSAALAAGNPAHESRAKFLSPTDPAAAWNNKGGRGRFGYFTNYRIDPAHAVISDIEATPARMAQEIKATQAMLHRIEERHGIKPERLAGRYSLWYLAVSRMA